jgi:serine/threonine protein kinase
MAILKNMETSKKLEILKNFIKKHNVPLTNQQIDRIKLIGSGTNAHIFNVGGNKLIKFGTYNKKSNIHNAKHEYNFTKAVGHKFNFVPRVIGEFYGKTNNGSLFMLEKVKGVTLTEFSEKATAEQLKSVRKTLLNYVNKLESQRFIHGDLNPNNIMIEVLQDGKLKVTLIDFGRGRYTTNNINNNILVHPWPTKLGCTPHTINSRTCKLEYVFTKKGLSGMTAKSNKGSINAFFGKRGGIVSRANRIKNIISIIASHQTKQSMEKGHDPLFQASNGKNGKPGQRETLIKLLKNFEKNNNRIPGFIQRIELRKSTNNYDAHPTVTNFIKMLKEFKQFEYRIPRNTTSPVINNRPRLVTPYHPVSSHTIRQALKHYSRPKTPNL